MLGHQYQSECARLSLVYSNSHWPGLFAILIFGHLRDVSGSAPPSVMLTHSPFKLTSSQSSHLPSLAASKPFAHPPFLQCLLMTLSQIRNHTCGLHSRRWVCSIDTK